VASCNKQVTILIFIDYLKCYPIATYRPRCQCPCGVPGVLGYSIPSLGAAGWPEHLGVLPEQQSQR